MSRRRNNPLPEPLSIQVRAYRIETAQRFYDGCGDNVKRLTDSILDSLFGMNFPKLAGAIEAYQAKLGDAWAGDEPEEPEDINAPEAAEVAA